jgi:membrane fusion protein, multidrug efflux system
LCLLCKKELRILGEIMPSIFDKIKSYKNIKVISGVVVILLLYSAYQIYLWTNTQSTDNAYIEADISSISSEVGGVIERVFVKENNLVKAGQIIAQINSADYKARYEQAEAALDSAVHNVEMIKQNIKLAIISQNKAIESRGFAEKNFKISEIDYQRITELSKDNFASKKNLDSAKISYEKAKNDLSQAILDMETSKENVKLLEIKKLVAIAKSNTTLQERNLAKRALDNTNIRSTVDGVIGNSSLREGNFVRPGVVLFSVVPIDQLYVKANFKETQISKFKIGMVASVKIDSESGIIIKGIIRNISPATGSKFSLLPPANATGNFTKIVQRVPVTIDLNIPSEIRNKIVPGMSTLTSVRTDW